MRTQIKTPDSSAQQNLLTTAQWDTETTPVYAVVSAVAAVDGTELTELPSLHDAIDSEALNDLFTGRSDAGVEQVCFDYAGYTVTVHGSGEVHIHADSE